MVIGHQPGEQTIASVHSVYSWYDIKFISVFLTQVDRC